MFREFNEKRALYLQISGAKLSYLNAYGKVILLLLGISNVISLVEKVIYANFQQDFNIGEAAYILSVFAIVVSYISFIACDKITLGANLSLFGLFLIRAISDIVVITTMENELMETAGIISGAINMGYGLVRLGVVIAGIILAALSILHIFIFVRYRKFFVMSTDDMQKEIDFYADDSDIKDFVMLQQGK